MKSVSGLSGRYKPPAGVELKTLRLPGKEVRALGLSHPYASKLVRLGEAALYLAALASLAYAVATAPQEGKDLADFRDMGKAWAAGIYQNQEEIFYGPPPFAAVLFSPLAVFSFEQWRAIFAVLNLLATALILLFVKNLWGARWPARALVSLAALFLVWAPFRVAVRHGQISLIVTAVLLGAWLAWKRERNLVAGVLLGLSLIKYPLTLPFALYFVWRKEWKIVGAALVTVGALTEVFAFRLGLSLIEVTGDYLRIMFHTSISNDSHFAGATEIGPLLFALTGNEPLANKLNIALAAVALVSMGLVFMRTPKNEKLHLAVLALFSLWYVYHRIYDAVICVLPAAVFIDLILRDKFKRLAAAGISALGFLAISIPGFLTERLQLGGESLSNNPAGFLGLHLERLVVFMLFWWLLVFLWQANRVELRDSNARDARALQDEPA